MAHLDLTSPALHLSISPTAYTLLRLGPSALVPPQLHPLLLETNEFISVTRTAHELSIVYPASHDIGVGVGDEVEGPWSMIRVAGPMELHMTGVLHRLSTPLAAAGVAIFALSTYNTDHVLVHEADKDKARTALEGDGWIFE